jgi:hypothetical protein
VHCIARFFFLFLPSFSTFISDSDEHHIISRLPRPNKRTFEQFSSSDSTAKDQTVALPSGLLAVQTRSIRGIRNYSLSFPLCLACYVNFVLSSSVRFCATGSEIGSAKFNLMYQGTLPSPNIA